MQAGKLRNRVTIQTKTETVSADGTRTFSWANSSKRWASIEPARTQESDGDRTHLIRLRYDSQLALTASQRIKYGTRIFNIGSIVNVDERDRELLVACTEDLT